MRTTHHPSCFGIPRPSCAPWLFLHDLSHLFLHSRHTSSVCLFHPFMLCHTSSFILFHLPLPSLHALSHLFLHSRHTSSICFHLPLPPTSKNFQRRFICHNVTTSGRYLGATWHQKHHIIFLVRNTKYEPNRGMQKVEQILTWEGSLPFL